MESGLGLRPHEFESRILRHGLGPSLAAIVLKLDAARSRDQEGERNALLAEIRDETRSAIGEVRRLVDDPHPLTC